MLWWLSMQFFLITYIIQQIFKRCYSAYIIWKCSTNFSNIEPCWTFLFSLSLYPPLDSVCQKQDFVTDLLFYFGNKISQYVKCFNLTQLTVPLGASPKLMRLFLFLFVRSWRKKILLLIVQTIGCQGLVKICYPTIFPLFTIIPFFTDIYLCWNLLPE